MVASRFFQIRAFQRVVPVPKKQKKDKIGLKANISSWTRLLNLEVPHESVLLLDLRHPVAELGADGPDGGVQLLHACSVRLVLSCRKLLLYIIFLFTAIYLTSNLFCSTLEGSGILVGFQF